MCHFSDPRVLDDARLLQEVPGSILAILLQGYIIPVDSVSGFRDRYHTDGRPKHLPSPSLGLPFSPPPGPRPSTLCLHLKRAQNVIRTTPNNTAIPATTIPIIAGTGIELLFSDGKTSLGSGSVAVGGGRREVEVSVDEVVSHSPQPGGVVGILVPINVDQGAVSVVSVVVSVESEVELELELELAGRVSM